MFLYTFSQYKLRIFEALFLYNKFEEPQTFTKHTTLKIETNLLFQNKKIETQIIL